MLVGNPRNPAETPESDRLVRFRNELTTLKMYVSEILESVTFCQGSHTWGFRLDHPHIVKLYEHFEAIHRHTGFHFLDYPKIDLNPGVLLLGGMNHPGFESILG